MQSLRSKDRISFSTDRPLPKNDRMSGVATYITLPAAHVDRAADFYETVFQWPRSRAVRDARFFELPNLTIALMEIEAFAKFTGANLTEPRTTGVLCSWNVGTQDEVDQLTERAAKLGAVVLREAAELDWGGRAAIIRTLDGHLWEIVWNPKLG